MKQYLTVFLAFLLLALPGVAWASGCDCGSVSAIVMRAQAQTVQQVNAHTTAEATAIRSEILQAAQNIIGTIQTQTATLVRAITGLKERNAAQLKGEALASEAMKTQDRYGKASQPAALCGSTSVGAGVQLGAQAQEKVHEAMRQKQVDYSNKAGAKPVEYLNRVLADDHPDIKNMTDSLWPLKNTLTEEEVGKAQETIKSIGNPRPMPVVTDDQKETPAGQTYDAARKIHEGRLAAAMEAMNYHTAYHAPTLPDDVTTWAQNQWKEAGSSGTPPGVVNGKLSEAGLYELLARMRMGNPNWFQQLAQANDTGLLRELVMMQAVNLELTRKNNEFLDRLTFLISLDYVTRMEGTTGKDMEELYTRMVGTQQ